MGKALLAALALAVVMPASAGAQTVALTTVSVEDRYPRVTFTAPNADDVTVYFATRPDRSTDGRFLEPNIAALDLMTGQEIATGVWSSSSRLAPGRYWVALHADRWTDDGYFSGWSNVLELEVPKPPPPRLPTLAVADAKHYVRVALRRRFKATFRHGYAKRVTRCKRQSRLRIRCNRVSWVIGDSSYQGWVAIRRSRGKGGKVRWSYSYRITRLNEYCAVMGGKRKDCVKVYRVR